MLNKQQLQTRILNTREAINRSQEYLIHKKKNAEENPESIFYQGALKNALEFIEEMKKNLEEYETQLKDGKYVKDNT